MDVDEVLSRTQPSRFCERQKNPLFMSSFSVIVPLYKDKHHFHQLPYRSFMCAVIMLAIHFGGPIFFPFKFLFSFSPDKAPLRKRKIQKNR